jgi:co-chaperonin GroES (HSP10)
MAVEIYNNLFQGAEDSLEQPQAEFESFQPLNDLVLVKRYSEDNSKAGSFIVPEKFRQQSNRGTVVAIGYDVEPSISAGDIVTFGIGNAENIIIHGEEHLLIRANDLRGVERRK